MSAADLDAADEQRGVTQAGGEAEHRPYVTWTVDVFVLEDETDPVQIARDAYDVYMGAQMYPVLTVHLSDGTTLDVDLEEVGLGG